MSYVTIVGAGLAGVEAAFAVAKLGYKVRLYEMRPLKMTPAHKTPYFAELVCSNSLKSDSPDTASGLLKSEMRLLGSVLLKVAEEVKVPAGSALAVDRNLFAQEITEMVKNCKKIEVINKEITELPSERPCIIATGPLTSDALAKAIEDFLGVGSLSFYDAIAPIVDGESIDYSCAFWGDRYGKGSGDYLNCPLTKEEYERFYQALIEAECVPFKEFEEPKYFEGCMPIEEMARRGKETLLFGPMKPVGLVDPRTGKQPFAVVQLRKEDREGRMFNIVGFQTKMKYPEQDRVFRLIPALRNAEFLRYGSIHRNTYINSPKVLEATLQCKRDRALFFAGQITGVEGYMESASTGIIAGINAARLVDYKDPIVPPEVTMIGALLRYISTPKKDFQPMNANFGLLPQLDNKIRDKKKKKLMLYERAIQAMKKWIEENNLEVLRREVV
ncbi:methylenetetrahydrofolate--tRNA-(uracil-5-)-methyltransferase [Thermosulfidibacter takaii ABI70S6]|uniref:Methylenetetrahydrofolate--tRNA-(uracil-5-)-methyltransferase TrmFO n=1 Tax=Thermosulfidibacter takaii (strain DSM 17441 / JCM 13301 / NBRC 103674 / ABI70S6) TaxID=1298851 RepID=A0A0S3QV41_THET7|nr:methylenetetrahydrofolate--tRNA-(uracil(54)-C(5))-methyltransferase (FADH(2)-oxidizing) TrmFO [Thermosulfidibacter takaii]BAT72192.1 methylenetetrahydrofolate--tRNA-(uracil-5-)-methyltransferase [Thermosulfidibacter takaii ABI70S6]